MKYFIISGEASGDLHGSSLVRALAKEDPQASIQCWGGDLMAAAGARVLKHYRELAFMGFSEVLKNLGTILQNFKICKREILAFQPDVLILIDYPGFNLRMAQWAKKAGIRVFYYISPQLWAWKSGRVKIIRRCVDRMFVILPFEKAFYEKYGVEVDFPGHPLLDVVHAQTFDLDFFAKNGLDLNYPVIALLPGSRRQEIRTMLGTMLEMPAYFPACQFVIAGAPSIEQAFYAPFLEKHKNVALLENKTYPLLQHAHAALVTSGTATLETALFNVPQVVCYKGNQLSFLLAKQLVNKDLQYIAMPNLVAGKALVKELLQDDFNVENLKTALGEILAGKRREEMLEGYKLLQEKLGQGGASALTAKWMVERLKGA
ncbi:MAG: lipid-A-disaccharide synthase [Lewinellaceae bacterium]|nr:lipid-A-disaccharide synthase [Lewinellaceae bacterium]